MELYIEKATAGTYGICDTFLNETVSLNTKTTYVQDITAVFKGFTNDFSVQATPNNIKLLGYFGYTDQLTPSSIQKRAKLYLDGNLYREGLITLKNTAWVNDAPSLFQLEFSDGQKNLSDILGEDTLSMLGDTDGSISWTSSNIQKALTSIQTGSGGIRWFVPLVSTERIFSIFTDTSNVNTTDNIGYNITKPIDSENVLLSTEIRPAVFLSDILKQIEKKYSVSIAPTPYVNGYSQLTDLATMCTSSLAITAVQASLKQTTDWTADAFREERFDIIRKPTLGEGGFELNYLGFGSGGAHDATFDMIIKLRKTDNSLANGKYINSIEVWEMTAAGEKKKKLNYQIESGSETFSAELRVRIGLDVFTPDGSSSPSTLVKPLIAVFVAATDLAEWAHTYVGFNWHDETWIKYIDVNYQFVTSPTTLNLFENLADMKTIDFVKSIYTMFGYKKFKDKVLNDFYYADKTVKGIAHKGVKGVNDLTPYADLSKMTKATNTKYDGYDLKHATSEYQQNVAFALANTLEYGEQKFPLTGKPNTPFTIETKFTAPVFNPIKSEASTIIYTFYPFGSEPHLNDAETRFIYDTITKEFPIFYYNGVGTTPAVAFFDTDAKILKGITSYHKISHKNSSIKTGADNYITSLFNTLVGADYIDQNTLYVQAFKTYIEDTLSGKKLIHSVDLTLPSTEVLNFKDEDEIIIKETRYTVLESTFSLNDGKAKLSLLNK